MNFRFNIINADSAKEIKERVSNALEEYADIFPASKTAAILLKPNLNANMNALTGNTTDLRLLAAVIEYFKAKGYETELGPGSGDGGVDIRMISRSGIQGDFLTLVQAKKYAQQNKIKLEPVQALYGVLEDQKASKGLFVTTSSYEPCAKRFAESKPFRLQLADSSDVRKWLEEYTQRSGKR